MSDLTHYDGCYREHAAAREIERLTRERDELRHDIERALDNHAAGLRERDELHAERDAMRAALRIIAGYTQCADNTLGNVEIARAALAASTESLSGGNPGEKSASRRADHRGLPSAGSADEESTGIARAAQSESHRGAEQLSADSAERRSPVARDSATPDEGNRQQAALAEGADPTAGNSFNAFVRRDAERYRYLRQPREHCAVFFEDENEDGYTNTHYALVRDELDRAVDAAMEAEGAAACSECNSPFEGSHFSDCKTATGAAGPREERPSGAQEGT